MKPATKAIRARAEAAAEGPWGVWEGHAEIWAGIIENEPGCITARGGCGPVGRFENEDGEDDEQAIDNAVFAAAARTDVPALCDRVEALEAALRRIDDGCCSCRDGLHDPGDKTCSREIARAALEGEL